MLTWPCNCTKGKLERVERALWMRALPLLRLYQCSACGRKMLLRERTAARAMMARARSDDTRPRQT